MVRPSRNYHFGTYMLKTIQIQEVTSYTNLPRTHGSSKQVCNSLKLKKKINLCNGWYVVATFGCHVVWPQKNNNIKVISTNIYFYYKCHSDLLWEASLFCLGGQFCACKLWLNLKISCGATKYHVVRPLQTVFHDRYMS